MGAPIAYRDARSEDAAALAAFSRDTFVETFGHLYPPEDLAAFLTEKYGELIQRREIEDRAIHYRLAFQDGGVVGYCKSGPFTLPVAPQPANAVELHRLYIATALKGAGVAKALMDEALDWARAQGADALYLSVWEENHRAQAFYRRYGFEHAGEHAFAVGRVRDRDWIWRLAL